MFHLVFGHETCAVGLKDLTFVIQLGPINQSRQKLGFLESKTGSRFPIIRAINIFMAEKSEKNSTCVVAFGRCESSWYQLRRWVRNKVGENLSNGILIDFSQWQGYQTLALRNFLSWLAGFSFLKPKDWTVFSTSSLPAINTNWSSSQVWHFHHNYFKIITKSWKNNRLNIHKRT